MNHKVHKLVQSLPFIIVINLVILVNAALIGVETFYTSILVSNVQDATLVVFTIEIFLRFIGRISTREYFKDGWNIFDIIIVGLCYIPEAWITNSAAISVLRIMRVLRILRLIKIFPELKIIVRVLLKSMKSLVYTFMLLLIFMYMYAVMGVILFRGGSVADGKSELGPQNPDPYGTIAEAFFTLFRIMTGEDWTDLRYNLLGGHLEGVSDLAVTLYHVSWIGLSAFLLINLVIGAVVNNYDQVMAEVRGEKKIDVNLLYSKLDSLEHQLRQMQIEIKRSQQGSL